MNANGTAIFIEPKGTLLEALRARKTWLEQTLPGQAYVAHPPHCTLLFGNYGPSSVWLEPLRQQIGAIPAFELGTDAWQQFPRDPLAGGGHTVGYHVGPNPGLMRLQQVVANCLSPYVVPGPVPHPLAKTEPFARSLKQFGFPFVGPHWIPHFTIGSPLVAPEAPLLAELMAGPAEHRFVVDTLSVWSVAGDRHDRLHELALAKARSY